MINQIGRFKVWDTLEKKILEGNYALTDYEDIGSLKELRDDEEGVYLHAIGRRDRYIVIPELPRQDQAGNKLWVGDLLSSGNENLWVIRFDLMKGVYCSLVSMPHSYNELDFLIESGLIKVGNIFSGQVLRQGENYVAMMHFNPEDFLK